MKLRLSDVPTMMLAFCAVIVTGLLVRRELFDMRRPSEPAFTVVEDWRKLQAGGTRLGASDGTILAIEFSDFQCPFCAEASARLDELLAREPGTAAIVVRHYPLKEIHPHAVAAAVASECAAKQGRFADFRKVVYRSRAALGSQAWNAFAEEARVEDISEFERCVSAGEPLRRVEQDKRLGDSLGVRGTPAYIIDGRLYTGLGGLKILEDLITKN